MVRTQVHNLSSAKTSLIQTGRLQPDKLEAKTEQRPARLATSRLRKNVNSTRLIINKYWRTKGLHNG